MSLNDTERGHIFHAHAYVLDATLEQPVQNRTGRQALVDLPSDGKYQFQSAKPFQLFGVLSYRSGYTQVAGHKSPKGNGHTTLATSVIEDLNVLDVVTADRVVGQISTTHPFTGQAPSVTFLGTRFVNLRIGGHKVDVETDLHILGHQAPAGGASYLDDAGVLARMSQQHARIKAGGDLPDWANDHFRDNGVSLSEGRASCSLVKKIHGNPGQCFGHVIDVPHFGKIFLGELTVQRKPAKSKDEEEAYHFHLTMIRLQMGCIGTGSAKIVAMDANGKGGKGGGG